MTDDVKVRFGADTAELKAGIESMQSDMNSRLGSINGKLSEFSAKAQESTAKASEAFKSSMESMKSSMEGFTGVMNKVNAMMGLFAEVAIGGMVGEKLIGMGEKAAEYGDQLERASKKTGIATGELQGLKYAAQMSDVSFQSLQMGLARLSRSMLTAEQGGKPLQAAFESIGISADQLKNIKVEDILAKMADKFSVTQDGAAKTAVAMQLFGRAGADMIPLLDKGSSNLAALTAEAKKLGLVLDEQTIQSSAAMADQLKTLHAQTSQASTAFGIALMPAMRAVSSAMSDGLAPGGALASMLKGLGMVVTDLTYGLSYVAQAFESMGISIAGVAASINAAIHGDFAGAKQITAEANADLAATTDRFNKFRDELMNPVKLAKPETATDKGALDVPVQASMNGKDTRVAQWKAELDQKRDAEGAYQSLSKADEIKFWQDKLSQTKKGTKDYAAVFHELVGLERQEYAQMVGEDKKAWATRVANAKKAAAEQLAVEVAAINQEAQLGKLKIAADQETDRYLLASGQITDQQKLQRDQELADREYQIERDLLTKKLGLYQEDPKNYQKVTDQIQKLDEQHSIQIQKNADNTALAVQNSYTKMLSPISSAFDTSMKGIIMGTQTWQKGMSNILQSVVGDFVSSFVGIETKWAATELAKTMATNAGNAARTASNVAANSQSLTMSAGTVVKSIMNDAAASFAGVFKALAGIPIIGPALAAVAAPAAMGTVAAVAGNVASSADGEWNVPSDRLNYVHKSETILPAHVAQPLRDMVEGGGSGGSPQIHIHATDAKSVQRLFANNGAALGAALKGQMRSFAR